MGTLFIVRDRIAYREALKEFADALAPLIVEEAQRRTEYRLRLAAKIEELAIHRQLKLKGPLDRFGSSPAVTTDSLRDLPLVPGAESPRGSDWESPDRPAQESSPAVPLITADLGAPWELVPDLLPTNPPTDGPAPETTPDRSTLPALPDSAVPASGVELSALEAGPMIAQWRPPTEPDERGPEVTGSPPHPEVPGPGSLSDRQLADVGPSEPKSWARAERIACPRCGALTRRDNLSRHSKRCPGTKGEAS